MKKSIRFILVLQACILAGCAQHYYNPAPHTLPPHVRKIAVRPFTNHSKRVHIEHSLTMAVESAFNRDGRWHITDEQQADGVVIGDITRYILMPLKHDANNATTEYKIWVLVNVSLYDLVHQRTLWTESNMEAKITAAPISSGLPGSISESEAQQKMWDQLAANIATRTFDGFGTVTGASEKAVPKSEPHVP